MDVKVGNGAFCSTPEQATVLARSLVQVARGAGLPTVALVTDMNQVLAQPPAMRWKCRRRWRADRCRREPRLLEVTLALSAQLLRLGGLDADLERGARRARAGARERPRRRTFARMVAALGGPARRARRPAADRQRRSRRRAGATRGVLSAMDTRALGLAVVASAAGGARPGDAVDPRVGFSQVRGLGTRLQAGEAMVCVHAADSRCGRRCRARLRRRDHAG